MKTLKKSFRKIGVLGGTFDPPHIGHLEIAKFAIKKLGLSKLIWSVTKKNPLKQKSSITLKNRIILSRIITKNIKKIEVKSFDNLIKSSKTIKLIEYIAKNNKGSKIFFLMGSDNLTNFHKWHQWKKIASLCKITVFPRTGFMKQVLTCKALNSLGKQKILFIKAKRINISSSKIRKNYLKYRN
tara:strand:+ start:6646 stop:7197 length:552 start_codon:yes stop_codon:yes gene_type:complete